MIYVSSSCLKGKHISMIITQLAEAGIRNIELSGGTDYYPELEEDLIKLKKKYCLNYVCHAYFPPPEEAMVVNLASCDDDIYQKTISHYEKCIRLLEKLQCDVLSVHAGFLIRTGVQEIGKKLKGTIRYDEKMAYERFCDAYGYINDLCQKLGITLYLENNVLSHENYQSFQKHNYLMMTDYASIMDMKKMIDFNLLLDLGHLYVSSHTLGLDYHRECSNLRKYIKWIHISENNGITDQHLPVVGKSPILTELERTYTKDLNITLETVGDIDEIRSSVTYVEMSLDKMVR